MKKTILLFTVILALSGCGDTAEVSTQTLETNTESVKSDNIYASDAQQLVWAVRAAHPAFVIDALPEGYDAAEREFLENAPTAADKDEFALMAEKYMVSLKDEHTTLSGIYEELPKSITDLKRYCLNAINSYNYEDGKLYLRNEDGTSSENYIVSIDDVAVEEIYKKVDEYFPMENSESVGYYREKYTFSKTILKMCGCDVDKDELIIEQNNENIPSEFIDRMEGTDDEKPESANVRYVGDILYIDVNSFMEKDDKYVKALDEIRGYAQNGVNKIILDLRGNNGGYMWIVTETMRAFGMNMPYGETIYRHSSDEWVTCIKDLKTAAEDTYYSTNAPSLNSARVNPDIDLVVLCDINSMSASVETCAGVQDGKLGTVIGRSSHNSPSFYAGVLFYTLPETGINVQISSAYLKRADENAPQDVFVPDIVTGRYENALKYAVEQHYNETFNESDWQ